MSLPYKSWMATCSATQHFTPAEFCFPGTHDSGCYAGIDFGPVVDSSKMARSDERFAPAFQTMAKRWTITQPGSSIYLQLCHGVRYLDIRVGYCTEDNTYYLVHTFAVAKLCDALADIKRFVEENPTEVVIVDVKPYYDITDTKLAVIVESYIGSYMYPDKNQDGSFPDTLSAMVDKKQTVICIYHVQDPAKETRPSPRWYKASQCLFWWQFKTIDEVVNKEGYLTSILDDYIAARQKGKVPSLLQLSFTLTETSSDVAESVVSGANLGTLAVKMDSDIKRYLFGVLSAAHRQAISIITVDYESSSSLLPNVINLNQEKLAVYLKANTALSHGHAPNPPLTLRSPSHRLFFTKNFSRKIRRRRWWRSIRRLCCCGCACPESDSKAEKPLLSAHDTW